MSSKNYSGSMWIRKIEEAALRYEDLLRFLAYIEMAGNGS